MSTGLHRDLAVSELHRAQSLEFADATARGSYSATADDVGRICRQSDTGDFYILTDDSPVTWVQIGGSGGVPSSRNLTAGAGLTGGGNLSADRTFDIAANADGSISVNADDIQVGVLATDTQHGNRGGGSTHPDATGSASGFMSSSDKTKLDAISGTNTGDEVQATETALGIVEIATQSEVDAGTDTSRVVTPATLSGAIGTPVQHPYDDDDFYWEDHFVGDCLDAKWTPTCSGSGSDVDVIFGDQNKGLVMVKTGWDLGGYAQMTFGDHRCMDYANNCKIKMRLKLTSNTSISAYWGFWDGNMEYARFHADAGISSYFLTRTYNTALESKATTVLLDTDFHTFEVLTDDSGSSIKFYLDGVLVNTHSVQVPDNPTQPYIYIYSGEWSTKQIECDYVKLMEDE